MNVPLWVFLVVLAWAVVMTIFCIFRNPLPFPDRGHRCFGVPDENATRVVMYVLSKLTGLSERFTFDAGTTHQTLLWDNTTVIIHHDVETPAPNGLSVVVRDPERSAQRAAEMLKKAGYTATIKDDSMPGLRNQIVVVESNAFQGWVMVFRLHILRMGKPPNKRKLTKRQVTTFT